IARQVQVVAETDGEILAAEVDVELAGQADERLVLTSVDVRRGAVRARRDGVLEQGVRVVRGLAVRLHGDAEADGRDLVTFTRGKHVPAAKCHRRLLESHTADSRVLM